MSTRARRLLVSVCATFALLTATAYAQTATSTTLSASPPSPSTLGDNVTLTATVAPVAAAGVVQFRDGLTDLGAPVAVNSGVAVFVISTLGLGPHSLTAQ